MKKRRKKEYKEGKKKEVKIAKLNENKHALRAQAESRGNKVSVC